MVYILVCYISISDPFVGSKVDLFCLKVLQGLEKAPSARSRDWSESFEAMATGSCRIVVQWTGGLTSLVAVSVQREEQRWVVTLRPGFLLVNRTAALLHLCYTGATSCLPLRKAQLCEVLV